MEQGPSFRISEPKFPTNDPDYTMLSKQRSRYQFYYFYIIDEVLGPLCVRVGSFLPFQVTAYLNGHNFIERELIKEGVTFRKKDNSFTSVSDVTKLQQAADRFDLHRTLAR